MRPEDPIVRSPEDLALAAYTDGDYGCESSVRDATKVSRGTARVDYAREIEMDVPLIGVWKRYALPFTRQEAWDAWGRDAFDWECAPSVSPGTCESWPDPPERVPDDWDPGYDTEDHACWDFVPRGTPGAWPIWCCGPQAVGPPDEPWVPGTGQEDRT